ncbi:GNAT family N-acetyltransferase [Sphingobacterium sp. N143]|uniref:GNAT family N-acetyltransferase n=1 Tax=Sphingobacterium sp. N143 TaxID=2746727 RepID=UPI0025756643|nr:GNAT family N-acetyltransferase [Sphingobacterium sp. N143]MDM1292946.1 GNAT family N-acetyltransferase [Sphingobacterium sp. N143]
MSDWYVEQVFAARTWKLRKEIFSPEGSLADVMLEDDFNASHFAAYHKDEVVGVLTLTRRDDEYTVHFFAVRPIFRRQGVGYALVRYAQQFVRTLQGNRILVRSDDEHSRFWMNIGFRPLAKEENGRTLFSCSLEGDIVSQ